MKAGRHNSVEMRAFSQMETLCRVPIWHRKPVVRGVHT